MKICDLLTLDTIILNLNSNDKNGVIHELIDLFEGNDRVIKLESFRKAVIDREKIMSTGVGKGFAVPHAKTNAVRDVLIAFGRAKEPVNFESLDGQPVSLVVLLAAKENQVAPHIRLLSRVSRMMNKDEFRKALIEAETKEDILKIFCEEEKNFDSI
jgi:fructose-specific phosphotransferase system IIA component